MSETYICDVCDARIESGYTVCWAAKLTDSPAGVHYSSTKKTVNLCTECFPDENKSLLDRLVEMLTGGGE